MPAAAGAGQVPYRTFLIYNAVGGVVWGVGYCLLGYVAGSAYSAVESRVGAGLAIVVAAVVVAAVVTWTVRRHRAAHATPDTAAPAASWALGSTAAPAGGTALGSSAAPAGSMTPSSTPPGSTPPSDGMASGPGD
jgi:membrane-associated protein